MVVSNCLPKLADIDLAKTPPGDLQGINYAARHWLPKNPHSEKPVTRSTMYRYIREGRGGLRLPVLNGPGGFCTSRIAVQAWLQAVNEAKTRGASPVQTVSQDDLAELGLGPGRKSRKAAK